MLLPLPLLAVLLCLPSPPSSSPESLSESLSSLLLRRSKARAARDFPLADSLKASIIEHPVLAHLHLSHPSPSLSSLALSRLSSLPASSPELAGSKASDAAFWFALSGCADPPLFEGLAGAAHRELERFGERASCRPRDVKRVLEKLAASSVPPSHPVFSLGRSLLLRKDPKSDPPDLHFHHPRSLIWLFRGTSSTSQSRRPRASSLAHAASLSLPPPPPPPPPESYASLFQDPSLPLVLDLGCGLGVSLLALSADPAAPPRNYLGVDLDAGKVRFARATASRRGSPAAFVRDDALRAASLLAAGYPGPLSLALLQYPTPYSLPGAGNSRLPGRDGFMVGRPLMAALGRFRLLYLASNAPDVAAAMRAAAEAEGFAHREPGGQLSVRAISGGGGGETERGRRARELGLEVAGGKGWLGEGEGVLQEDARPETEVNAELTGARCYRILLANTRDCF